MARQQDVYTPPPQPPIMPWTPPEGGGAAPVEGTPEGTVYPDAPPNSIYWEEGSWIAPTDINFDYFSGVEGAQFYGPQSGYAPPMNPPDAIDDPALAQPPQRLMASGRPTAEYLGVTPETGGMPQPENRTWASSDVLMREAIAGLPPAFQQLANTKIERYANVPPGLYGGPPPDGGFNAGGGYYRGTYDRTDPATLERTRVPAMVGVGRGNDTQRFRSIDGPEDAVQIARHELMHQLAYEIQPYANDAQGGFTGLQRALQMSVPALQGSPLYRHLTPTIGRDVTVNDWGHVFTTLGIAVAQGMPLPPALQQYFAPMMAAPPATPRPSQPPARITPPGAGQPPQRPSSGPPPRIQL